VSVSVAPRTERKDNAGGTKENDRMAPSELLAAGQIGGRRPVASNMECDRGAFPCVNAGIAQLVEQLICNQQVFRDSVDMTIRDCSRPLKGQSNALANTDA